MEEEVDAKEAPTAGGLLRVWWQNSPVGTPCQPHPHAKRCAAVLPRRMRDEGLRGRRCHHPPLAASSRSARHFALPRRSSRTKCLPCMPPAKSRGSRRSRAIRPFRAQHNLMSTRLPYAYIAIHSLCTMGACTTYVYEAYAMGSYTYHHALPYIALSTLEVR
jgi:hypothetical protein